GGISWPVQSGHGCLGCSEDGFWDKGSFYDRVTGIHQFGIEANADVIGGAIAAGTGAAIAAHAALTALDGLRRRASNQEAKEEGIEA
ncbi:MAG: uptake hydrogenase small subunit, partial [Zoogloeaceae bacterium]|nr:uptake hydrogenase small subunit [Zoogloeaceae bacterium]